MCVPGVRAASTPTLTCWVRGGRLGLVSARRACARREATDAWPCCCRLGTCQATTIKLKRNRDEEACPKPIRRSYWAHLIQVAKEQA
jgi:hypothetical protein